MTAEIFLSCFLACLFAMTFVAVFGYQIARFFIKRAVTKHLPEILSKALHEGTGTLHGMSEADRAAVQELFRSAAQTPPGVVPHLPVVSCACGTKVDVPLEVPLQPYLEARGWKCADQFDGWGCPACVRMMA